MDINKAYDLIETHVKDMISLCPHCGAKVHIEKLWNDFHSFRDGSKEFYVIFRCKPCNKLILKTFYFKQNPYRTDEELKVEGWKEQFPVSIDDE